MERKGFFVIVFAAVCYTAVLAWMFDIRAVIDGFALALHIVASALTLAAFSYVCNRDNRNLELSLGSALLFFGFLSDAIGTVVALPSLLTLFVQDAARLAGFALIAVGGLKWFRRANELQTRLDDLTYRDDVTGLLNRKGFFRDAEPVLRSARKEGFTCAVIALEIDGFEKIAANHGSTFAEHVLQQFAGHIGGAFRRDDRFAYWGHARYMILLPHCDEQQCDMIVQRLKVYATQHAMICDGVQIRLNAHCGTAAQHDGSEPLQELVREASLALSRAKQSSRGHFFYTPGTNAG